MDAYIYTIISDSQQSAESIESDLEMFLNARQQKSVTYRQRVPASVSVLTKKPPRMVQKKRHWFSWQEQWAVDMVTEGEIPIEFFGEKWMLADEARRAITQCHFSIYGRPQNLDIQAIGGFFKELYLYIEVVDDWQANRRFPRLYVDPIYPHEYGRGYDYDAIRDCFTQGSASEIFNFISVLKHHKNSSGSIGCTDPFTIWTPHLSYKPA